MMTSLLLTSLAIVGKVASPSHSIDGFDDWRFGMSPDEVSAVREQGPYQKVPSTGGLETRNGRFSGERSTISFVFGPEGLYHIQIWAYEGQSFDDAAAAFERSYHYLVREFGAVYSDGQRWPSDLDSKAIRELIPDSFQSSESDGFGELQGNGRVEANIERLHLHPAVPIAGAQVYASFLHSSSLGLYWVFVYYKAPHLAP